MCERTSNVSLLFYFTVFCSTISQWLYHFGCLICVILNVIVAIRNKCNRSLSLVLNRGSLMLPFSCVQWILLISLASFYSIVRHQSYPWNHLIFLILCSYILDAIVFFSIVSHLSIPISFHVARALFIYWQSQIMSLVYQC